MPDRRHMISRRIKGVSAYLEASLAVALSSAGLILKAPDGPCSHGNGEPDHDRRNEFESELFHNE